MAASKLSQEERLKRKREAAKLRQRRCRAKKREAELQKLRKSKSKSNVSSKAKGTHQLVNHSHGSTVNPEIQTKLSSVTNTIHSKATKDLLISTPCSSSSSNTTCSKHNVVTPHGNTSSLLPCMPPLSKSHSIDRDRERSTCTPPASMADQELTAIDAILSLRHSPVMVPENKIIPPSPTSFITETKLMHSTGENRTCNFNLPFLPEIQSSAKHAIPTALGCKHPAARSALTHHCYENYGLQRYSPSKTERGDRKSVV